MSSGKTPRWPPINRARLIEGSRGNCVFCVERRGYGLKLLCKECPIRHYCRNDQASIIKWSRAKLAIYVETLDELVGINE